MSMLIQNLRSVTPGVAPATLAPGQLCFNVADEVMYVGDGSSTQTLFDGTQTAAPAGEGWFAIPLSLEGLSEFLLLNPEPYQGAASNGQVLTYSGTLGKPVWDLAAASQIFYDNAATGIPATTVQDAIDQTWDEANNALSVASSCLPLAGGTMTGDITFNNGQPIDAGTF